MQGRVLGRVMGLEDSQQAAVCFSMLVLYQISAQSSCLILPSKHCMDGLEP